MSTGIENLDLIVSVDLPPNPVELISSERTTDLLQEVKQMYDYVIVDTPPFGLVSDAFLLMKYSDLNIFVARLNYVTKQALKINMEEIREKNIDHTYLIVNSIKRGRSGYYGYKGYPYRKRKPLWRRISGRSSAKKAREPAT
jgi:Mrp family chromosome partitioning ATPase